MEISQEETDVKLVFQEDNLNSGAQDRLKEEGRKQNLEVWPFKAGRGRGKWHLATDPI